MTLPLKASFLRKKSLLLLLALGLPLLLRAQTTPDASTTQVPLAFTGGHETDPRDHGRPVVLIAAALGVPSEVFRDAFSRVHPAGPDKGGPTDDEARANKQALMATLGPYGVTDDRLNAVSNHYRYRAWANELWPTQPATGYALVKEGAVTGFVITNGGSGYSSPPAVTLPSLPNAACAAQLSFSQDFDKNGAVSSVALAPVK